jgi:hypothetical protein
MTMRCLRALNMTMQDMGQSTGTTQALPIAADTARSTPVSSSREGLDDSLFLSNTRAEKRTFLT